jgi:prepilin-type N-terminal cleavage/methylation domain-containing protein
MPDAPAIACQRRAGFTLAEVAVTLVITGIALLLVLQGLTTAKTTALYTHDVKLARELALLTLSDVESGLYWEELDADTRLDGNYAKQDHPEFGFEVVFGDESFRGESEEDDPRFDSWAPRDDEEELDPEDRVEEPYEKVRIRVTWPTYHKDLKGELELERWIPWNQVYETEEEAGGSGGATDGGAK